MAGSMNIKKISKSQQLFRLSLGIGVVVALAFIGIKCLTLAKSAELKIVRNKIATKEEQLKKDEASEGYKKFLAVKSLEDKDLNMTWYDRIEKISEILEDLRSLNDDEEGTTLELSDFSVSLEEISLRGIVSSLKDLYYTSASGKMRAVLDRFESLDFIDKMVIKEYNNNGNGFEFSLFANVINNDGK